MQALTDESVVLDYDDLYLILSDSAEDYIRQLGGLYDAYRFVANEESLMMALTYYLARLCLNHNVEYHQIFLAMVKGMSHGILFEKANNNCMKIDYDHIPYEELEARIGDQHNFYLMNCSCGLMVAIKNNFTNRTHDDIFETSWENVNNRKTLLPLFTTRNHIIDFGFDIVQQKVKQYGYQTTVERLLSVAAECIGVLYGAMEENAGVFGTPEKMAEVLSQIWSVQIFLAQQHTDDIPNRNNIHTVEDRVPRL